MVEISRSLSYENPNDFNCKDVRRHNMKGKHAILRLEMMTKIMKMLIFRIQPKKLLIMHPSKPFLFSGEHHILIKLLIKSPYVWFLKKLLQKLII